jgi:hypothetical protein
VFAAAPLYAYFADKEDGLNGDKISLQVSALSGMIFIGLSYVMFKLTGQGRDSFICFLDCKEIDAAG